jgi:hypothetical protein
MLDITILTTMLVKFEDGRESLVHYDPTSKKLFSSDNLTDEEIFSIRQEFQRSYMTVEQVENQSIMDTSFYEDSLNYYINQDHKL